jgi:hypothetical protein
MIQYSIRYRKTRSREGGRCPSLAARRCQPARHASGAVNDPRGDEDVDDGTHEVIAERRAFVREKQDLDSTRELAFDRVGERDVQLDVSKRRGKTRSVFPRKILRSHVRTIPGRSVCLASPPEP